MNSNVWSRGAELVRVSVVLALSVLDIAVPSGARAAAPTPADAPTPGQIQSTLPIAPPQPQFKSAPLTATPPPSAPADIAPGGPTVVAQRFVIEGNSVYSDAVLQPLIADWLNKPLTLAELYQVADVLTKYYQSHGYLVARATV
ncbi:MAG: POTRA domain-containing protein, partial [Terriglobales bacterium]